MKLDGLQTFCSVVEQGSFRAAAAHINRSQPAVSQQIKALEEELGHLLIERKGCRLTPAGDRLYNRARHILAEADSLVRELEDLERDVPRELRVGTSDTTALYVLPPVVAAFSREMARVTGVGESSHPTRLVIANRPSDALADQVLRGELDLGIVVLPMGHEELEELDLFTQRLVLVMPGNHRLGSRERVKLSELAGENMLLLHATTRTGALLQDFFHIKNFAPQVVLDSGSFEVIKRYVGTGIGVSFLPETVVTQHDRDLATATVAGLPHVRIGAIWRRHAHLSQAARTFLELVKTTGQPE